MEKQIYRYPVIAGPTASGKTALAVRLAQAVDGEVVSADSMQIYADIHIGTARPSEEEMQGIPHHLLGFLPLEESYSVARYMEDAHRVFADIFRRGHVPVMCGGTGLYIQSFMENIQFFPQPSDPALRQRLQAQAMQEGGAALLRQLAQVDAETAARLHENDLNRIIRALEVYHTTGQTISQQARLSHSVPSPYTPCLFVLDFRDRAALYARIDARVEQMLQEGLLDEARQVLRTNRDATALQAIGYKELLPYFQGDCSLEQAVEQLKIGTHHYAKRQIAWFKRMKDAHHVYVDDYPDAGALALDVQRLFAGS